MSNEVVKVNERTKTQMWKYKVKEIIAIFLPLVHRNDKEVLFKYVHIPCPLVNLLVHTVWSTAK